MFGAPSCQASCLRLAAPLLIAIAFAAVATADQCSETQAADCDKLAFCDSVTGCTCPRGIFDASLSLGDTPGTNCTTESAVVRISWKIGNAWNSDMVSGSETQLTQAAYDTVKADVKTNLMLNVVPTGYDDSFTYDVVGEGALKWFSAAILYSDLDAAKDAISALETAHPLLMDGTLNGELSVNSLALTRTADIFTVEKAQDQLNPLQDGYMSVEPRAYTFTAGTTDDPVFIKPVGLDVDRVFFKHNCLSAGCWVVDVTYTIGEDNFNVFYVPRTNNDDSLSYDYDYETDAPSIEETFYPVNFPCGNDAYTQDPTAGVETTVSACCITRFLANYRNLVDFKYDVETDLAAKTALDDACWGAGNENVNGDIINHPNAPVITTDDMPKHALEGYFSGYGGGPGSGLMGYSYVASTGVIDPFLGIYTATFYMDEIELRKYCGKLSGTVSVQHTVDFFVGLAEFKPTGLDNGLLDMATKQVDIKVEKTDYFTVATHGTNDYTFLRYVNMRLVEVLLKDDSNIADVASDNFDRTSRDILAQYVQVTFTVGSKYAVKPGYDIIPLDSVRVGQGDFLVDNSLYHACEDYNKDYTQATFAANAMFDDSVDVLTGFTGEKAAFDHLVAQDCAPQTAMCSNPSNIDDSFVVFNVPVGFDYYPDPQSDLSANIFVSMVVQVQNTDAMAGVTQEANITKTTLTASIPVVSGGVNIFCDRITAKIDLQDVAQAWIWVGSANQQSELSRLRVVGKDGVGIASSTLNPRESAQIDSDSIESGLMTLVIAGNETYFENANQYGLEVEDIITIHIMEDADVVGGFDQNPCISVGCEVLSLVNSAGDENYDSNNELNGDGYRLNGAFFMRILTDENRARLDPTPELRNYCSFRTTGQETTPAGALFATTCIIRRDIDGKNTYNNDPNPPAGATTSIRVDNTATELPSCDSTATCTGDFASTPALRYGCLTPADFMVSIMGDSEYASTLGINYAALIRTEEKLNNRYRRAFWINPGYEWTPQQTGGATKFTVSQKILMFALINLNEVRGVPGSRRFLLADAAADPGDEQQNRFIQETTISPSKVMATVYGVEPDHMTQLSLTMKLTKEQVCDMSEWELFVSLNDIVEQHIKAVATVVAGSQVISVDVDKAGVSCSRRSISRKLLSYSGALAKVGVVVGFQDGMKEFAQLDVAKLSTLEGVELAEISATSAYEPPAKASSDPPPGTGDGSEDDVKIAEKETESDKIPGALIGGIVGGVVGVAVLAGAGYFLFKSKRADTADVPTAAQNDIENLKAQLQAA